jgi:hypothetical protein
MSRPHRKRLLALATCVLCSFLAAPAQASFHLISVREVFAGTSTAPTAEFIVLQMYEPGQNLTNGQQLRIYNSTGGVVSTNGFNNVPSGDNQRTILAATPDAVTAFGVSYDVFLNNVNFITADGGAACWSAFDCVSWGSFSNPGALPSPPGTPAATGGIPVNTSLTRTISRGCPTLLEATDDTNDSAADFGLVASPAPRNNAMVPTETACIPDTQGPGQTLTAKKVQDVDKAAVNELLSEAGAVTLKGKVTVPKVSRLARSQTLRLTARAVKTKKATKSLAANTPTKIKVKLSQGAKKKVKAAIEDSGPRKITVTATAKDALGNSTTKKVRFKLID